jgi:signal transduction histidine kinase
MKFWQKTFLILNTIFLIFLDVVILIIARESYQRQLQSYEEKATGEAYFIANSIYHDFTILAGRDELSISNEEKTYRSYSNYYNQQGIRLAIKEGSVLKYSDDLDFFADEVTLEADANAMLLRVETKDGEKYITVQVQLKEPYHSYSLLYSYHLVNFNQDWENMTYYFILAGVLISMLLSVVLYIVLRKLTKPILELNNATKEIYDGNYKKRVIVKGNDELARLGAYFNIMSEKIQQNIESLQKETEIKQRLVDNLAHELRTPLTAISGYAEYMQMANLNEEERYHAISYIRSETKRLEKLGEVLLLLADVRETNDSMGAVSVEKLITTIKKRFMQSLKEKNITISQNVTATKIYGNYELLEILISNLVENALRASKPGGKIEISTYEENQGLILAITDYGIGMSEENLLHIMEPFYRVDKARSRKHGGIGLGTALCKQIAQKHQATIQYESELELGTTVKLIFPKACVDCVMG